MTDLIGKYNISTGEAAGTDQDEEEEDPIPIDRSKN